MSSEKYFHLVRKKAQADIRSNTFESNAQSIGAMIAQLKDIGKLMESKGDLVPEPIQKGVIQLHNMLAQHGEMYVEMARQFAANQPKQKATEKKKPMLDLEDNVESNNVVDFNKAKSKRFRKLELD